MAKAKKKTSKKSTTDKPLSALDAVRAKYGKESVAYLGASAIRPMAHVSTGSIGLDRALGIGGLPLGRVVEIYGPESSGKTTLTLHVLASAQAKGLRCAFVDAEHALDPTYAKAIGVDVDDLLVSQPSSGEEALDILDIMVRSGGIDVVVVDSVAALTPKAEIDGELAQSLPGIHARLMSKALRRLVAAANQNNVLVIFINQIRMKIGVMFGNPETTTGGNALRFYSSVRLDIRRKAAVKDGDQTVAMGARVKVVKNKVAPPFREALFDIAFGTGIDQDAELLDLAAEQGAVEKSGAWYVRAGEKLGCGRAAALARLKSDPELRGELLSEVVDA